LPLSASLSLISRKIKEPCPLGLREDFVRTTSSLLSFNYINVKKLGVDRREDSLRVGNISIVGRTIFSRREIESLLPESGIPFNQSIFEGTINKILSYYTDHGFPFVVVSPKGLQVDSNCVSWKIFIEPGQIQRIGKVLMTGNTFTREEFLQRHLPIKEGSVFNETEIEKAIGELSRLDYITTDSFQIKKTGQVGWVDLVIYIDEGNRGEVWGLLSYSENGGFSGRLEAVNKNLFGGGRGIEFVWAKEGKIYQEERIRYTEPYIFSFPVDLTIELQHTAIETLINISSFSIGFIYSMRNFSLSILPGIENYAYSGEGTRSYPFFETRFSRMAKPVSLSYRQRWKKERGWDMEVSSEISFWRFEVDIEYFTLSSEQTELIFFNYCRGYPIIPASRGLRAGGELKLGIDQLTLYPLFDASWSEDLWRYSYGFGLEVNRISFEYAIPSCESPLKGRVYIRFGR
ncbi:hypothetical protein KAW48_03710, partial [candidate division WOR-3 bacterium]|nr:hypothetical protein [candidate division WOR-3 bacterium]